MNMNMSGIGGPGTIDTTGGSIGLSGIVGGVGGLIKIGAGTLSLGRPNTYSGGTTISGGILNLASAEVPGVSGPLGVGGVITFAGGRLQYSAANQYDYSSRFSANGNQPISVDTNGQTVTFATAMQGAGSSLSLNDTLGGGMLILAGSNTYTGPTSISGGGPWPARPIRFSPNSDLTINGGTLDATRFGQTIKSLSITSVAC